MNTARTLCERRDQPDVRRESGVQAARARPLVEEGWLRIGGALSTFSIRAIRRLGTLILVSALAVCVDGGVAAASTAGPSGSQVPDSLIPIGPYSPGTPFASGQNVEVSIPANSVLTPGSTVYALECSDPGGLSANDPTNVTDCDPNTVASFSPVGLDGSVRFTQYTIFALPDTIVLAEPASGTPVCNPSSECVLYVGLSSDGDPTQPHYFSQPFYVSANVDDGGENPGDGTPEAPLPLALPLLATGIVGGTFVLRRRMRPPTHGRPQDASQRDDVGS